MTRSSIDFFRRFHSRDSDTDFTVKNVAKWTAIVVIIVLGCLGTYKAYQVLFGETTSGGIQKKEPWSPFKNEAEKFIEEQDRIIAEARMKKRIEHLDHMQNVSRVLGGFDDSAEIFAEKMKELEGEMKFAETGSDKRAEETRREIEMNRVYVPSRTGEYGETLSNVKFNKYMNGSLPEGQARGLPDGYYARFNPPDRSHTYDTKGYGQSTPIRKQA